MTERKSTLIIAGIVAALLLLFGTYMGSYYVMVQRVNQVSFNGWKSVGFEYRIDGLWVYWFYRPAHRIDRVLRPSYWEEPLNRIRTPVTLPPDQRGRGGK